MAEVLKPAADQFVLRMPDTASGVPEAAASLGTVEPLGETEPLYLLTLAAQRPVHEAWTMLAKVLTGAQCAYPVLIDGDGAAHYPNGEVTVRFELTPTAAEVQQFAAGQRLVLQRANEFAPQQFVYSHAAPAAEFLPDLVARLASQPGVRAAWANTLSRYRRTAG